MCCKDCGGKVMAFADAYGGTYESCDNTYGTGSHDSYHAGRRKADIALLGDLLREAVDTDGAHHKQWYLEQIAERLEIPLPEHKPGIAP